MNLSIYDRIILGAQIIPSRGGSFREGLVARRIAKRLALSPQEQSAISLEETDEGNLSWDTSNARDLGVRDFEFSDDEIEIVCIGFEIYESEREEVDYQNDKIFDLYERFHNA